MIIWFLGLPASGKTTLSALLSERLRDRGLTVALLDGDVVRSRIGNFDFSRQGRERNIAALRDLAASLKPEHDLVVVAAITPYEALRARNRQDLPGYFEVYCQCGFEERLRRDPKGMYKAALEGKIQGFTGTTGEFEDPARPDLVVDTAGVHPQDSLALVFAALRSLLPVLEEGEEPARQGAPDQAVQDVPSPPRPGSCPLAGCAAFRWQGRTGTPLDSNRRPVRPARPRAADPA